MIVDLLKNVDNFFSKVESKYGKYLPFQGLFLGLAKEYVRANLTQLQAVLVPLVEGGADYDKAVDALVWYLKTKMRLPLKYFWLFPIVSLLADALGMYLKANKPKLLDSLIAQPGPK